MPNSRVKSEPVEAELQQSCPYGFTGDDLRRIFSESVLADFHEWMRGQTCMLCDGKTGSWVAAKLRNQDALCEYVGFFKYASPCHKNPHGVVTYAYDVKRYIAGGAARAVFD